MQRAVWTAAEILGSYQEEVEHFDLEMGGSGDFEFSIDDKLVYSKRETGEYPEMRTLKRAVVEAIDARS
jgi:selenoprotein W-related protein